MTYQRLFLIGFVIVTAIIIKVACGSSQETKDAPVNSEVGNRPSNLNLTNMEHVGRRADLSFVTVSGYVRTANGKGIPNALLAISGRTLAKPVHEFTDPSGKFVFTNISRGSWYVVTVKESSSTFKQPSQILEVVAPIDGLEFVAEPTNTRAAAKSREK